MICIVQFMIFKAEKRFSALFFYIFLLKIYIILSYIKLYKIYLLFIMSLKNLSGLFSLFPYVDDIETLNLKDEKDYKKFNDIVDNLESSTKDGFMSSIFTKEMFDAIRNLAKQCHDSDTEEICNHDCSSCENECCVHEEIIEEDDNVDTHEDEPKSILPSANISNIDTKMQIHRLTQEYVDTMLKPYMEKGPNTTNNINNAYTALFEFACWIFNHK